jgi:predicted nuclease of restriction endonuclease-like (RecB) superfamily
MAKAVKNTNVRSRLYESIAALLYQKHHVLDKAINVTMVTTYYHIGKLIVEHEQKGSKKAPYGRATLQALSRKLTVSFGRGYSVDNLENMRRFYAAYRPVQAMAHKIKTAGVSGKKPISETLSRKLTPAPESHQITPVFQLNWSHYVFLLRIETAEERKFYEIEAAENHWGIRDLKRHYDSALYERLVLSRNKAKVKELSKKGQVIRKPTDAIKDPYILEFLGLPEKEAWSESEFESAIIDKIEDFLKEMGKGFLFVERQQRIPVEENDHRIDLVFYHRILRCFILIDLKIGDLSARDLGQMQLYVGYYDQQVKQKTENPTIGIVLCKNKKESIVKYTLPKNNKQIFASKYKMYLPNKNDFQQLMEAETEYIRTPGGFHKWEDEN